MVPVAFDMETQDPDDVLALCVLATHPRARLAAVAVNPGTREQLGVVRGVLSRLGADAVPVGARDATRQGGAVSAFHREWLGDLGFADPDGPAHAVLAAALARDPATVLLSGAPLHDVRDLLREHPDVTVPRWVAQGGFAGDDLVPAQHRLPAFAGRDMVESHNFGANKRATLRVLGSPRVLERRLVSKNVTHGVVWDRALHDRVGRLDRITPGLRLAHEGMAVRLRRVPAGKALHDPLAACAVIEPSIVEWAEVEVLYAAGRWGARRARGTSTFISVGVDEAAFHDVLLEAA